jgi:hypothetical protein
MKHIETKKGLETLLERYLKAGVTDQTKDKWISAIKYCIDEGLAMDEIDYENTPRELRKLWVGLK